MPDRNSSITAFDLFSGGGGSSWGAKLAGATIAGGLDFDPVAGQTFKDNFPSARFYQARAEHIDPQEIASEIGAIDLLLASPECTNHTCAKGNGERSEDSRMTAFEVVRFADALMPTRIIIENVVHMQSWHRYREFLGKLRRRGYKVREFKLNAADFRVPQSRRRLFIVADKHERPTASIGDRSTNPAPLARDFVSMNGKFQSGPLYTERRAAATLIRAERAMKEVGRDPFLLVYYGSDAAGGWQRLEKPLRTVTTLDRFGLVKWEDGEYKLRMLQVPELRAAMGFDEGFALRRGTRRDKIRLLGNAVCPPVMQTIVTHLLNSEV